MACIEIENIWKQYLSAAKIPPAGKDYTTNDYVRLCNPLFLREYEIRIKPYRDIQPVRPYANWDSTHPTTSLNWYDAYNKTKHDRTNHFNKATLINCIYAISACIVLFCVRFSPFGLFQDSDALSTIMN